MKSLVLAIAITTTLWLDASAVDFSTAKIAGKRVTICRVNVRKERVQLLHRNETGQPFRRLDHLAAWLQARHQKPVFAMNAGMFKRDFSAVGLFIAEGKQLASLNTTNGEGNFFLKPNGVFAITEAGARVVESTAFPQIRERVLLATQSGPLLVQDGRIHPAFKTNSVSRLFRNGVGVPSPELAIFAISDDPLNFHEFATLFRDVLHCPNALFLDGTVSSLYAPALQRNDYRMDLGPMIAVTE